MKPNYQGNCIKSSLNTKFLGLTIDDSLSWKAHIDQIMFKLNTACFVIRTIQAITSLETLRMVYFACIHSIISYGKIFWGNQVYSDKIFKIQKRVIRIITSSRTRDSCRKLLKKLEIFFYWLYNRGWVLVCSTVLFHTCLSSISTLQPIIFILHRSSSTWSIHLNLGLPSGLVLYGFHSVNKLEILPLYSQYIYSISIFVIINKHLFYTNNQIHSTHTRFKTNLHPPTANLTKFQKGVYYSAIKIFNNLRLNLLTTLDLKF